MHYVKGKSDVIGNIRKCLAAGFDFILCLAVGRELADKAAEQLRDSALDLSKVRVIEVTEAIKQNKTLLQVIESSSE